MATPYLEADGLTILLGDALATLRELPDSSIDAALTSPPFFGLRDYGTSRWEGGDPDCPHRPDWKPRSDRNSGKLKSTSGTKMMGAESRGHRDGIFRDVCKRCGATRVDEQIGLEPTPDEFVERLVGVFAEVRRVLRPWGCLLLEVGDSYCSAPRGNAAGDDSSETSGLTNPQRQARVARPQGKTSARTGRRGATEQRSLEARFEGVKSKDIMGMPWALAFALRADGWWLRGEYIWDKPNPMPESVEDRCTTAHSRVFHLTCSERYFWDKWAIQEDAVAKSMGTWSERLHNARNAVPAGKNGTYRREYEPPAGRNARSVWRIPTEPSGLALCRVCRHFWERNAPLTHCGEEVVAHYAAFPPELAEKAIRASTSEHGVCSDCGRPYERVVEKGEPELAANTWSPVGAADQEELAGPGSTLKHVRHVETLGWRPTCECAALVVPATVVDPFGGSGTTLLAARTLRRRAVMVELNEDYCEIAARRLAIPEAVARASETSAEPTQLLLT